MKKLWFCLLCISAAHGMDRLPRTTALNSFRLKNQSEYFPDVAVPSDQDWNTVNQCFSELLKLELSSQNPKITFADAQRYCKFARMYRDQPQAQDWFDAEHVATIKRFTNLIMFSVFYPEGSGASYFGPSTDMVAHVVTHKYRAILQNTNDMSAIFNIQLQNFVEINSKLNQLINALINFKTNPPQRNKLEG